MNRHKWRVGQFQQTTEIAPKPGSPTCNISLSETVKIEYPFLVSKTMLRFPESSFCKQKRLQMSFGMRPLAAEADLPVRSWSIIVSRYVLDTNRCLQCVL
jgi:hypothetical protein